MAARCLSEPDPDDADQPGFVGNGEEGTAPDVAAGEQHEPESTPSQEEGFEVEQGIEELDRLYRQAFDAMEAVEVDLAAASVVLADSEPTEESGSAPVGREAPAGALTHDDGSLGGTSGQSIVREDRAHRSDPSDEFDAEDEADQERNLDRVSRVRPSQIIEAALFVGGRPLTVKRMVSLLGGDFDREKVEAIVETLNAQYADQARPYEIRFGEGGYQSVLKPEFESVCNRVFGLGPKEVKLSQETLEVLALVAYKQPLSALQIEEAGKKQAGTILRQLLRRELIAIERDSNTPKDVKYITTARFLDVFGLAGLNELPQAEELSFK